jgi:molecular chaperone DnaJ
LATSGLTSLVIFFDMFSGGRTGRSRRAGPERGDDLRYDLDITLEEAAIGIERDIEVYREERCATCDGSGTAPGTSPSTCPTCGGTGELREERATPFGRMVNVTASFALWRSGADYY